MKALIGGKLPFSHTVVPDFLLHLKLVAGIILSVFLFAAIVLIGMVLVISSEPGASYSDIFFKYSLTRERLQSALLVSGLLIVVVTAAVTWLIAIYTSRRIAGPLHRISLSLESAMDSGHVPEFNFRVGESFLEHAQALRQDFVAFKAHDREIENLRKQVSLALSQEEPDIEAASKSLAALQGEVRRVRT